MNEIDKKIGWQLVLDELLDLTLYQRLSQFATGEEKRILLELIPVEIGHLAFWKHFFKIENAQLNFSRRLKLSVLIFISRLFGKPGIHVVLEAIEVYGIRKYLDLWERYKDTEFGKGIHKILQDEFKHENEIVSTAKLTHIYPERVRDIFLGFNDGLVEILGAVAGFFAAFQNNASVLIAAVTVAVAGSISMAASAYAGLSSAREIEYTQLRKKKFLGESVSDAPQVSPLGSGALVGVFYFIGSLVPVLPVFFGAQDMILSIIASSIVIIIVSSIVAFLSGMDARRRIMLNLIIIALAVGITYSLANSAKAIFGIQL